MKANTHKIDIKHNLDVSKPNFLYFIKNMDKELCQWIQYSGVEIDGGNIFFKFKSSQNSLNFKVYGGVNINNVYYILRGKYTEIYDFFEKIKYHNI
jgi:hypothetical protein